ncbi:MAG: ABC transporter ATP-binding protein/permease [Proteobacteria bacterium]|nr:ABC transporter ATP-binding protein/permease [Pseudomonadota bacterium]
MSAPVPPLESDPSVGDSVRHALRRLFVYIRHNGVYYGVWTFLTLLYVFCFVAIPRLVGYAISAVEEGLPASELARRCQWLFAFTLLTAVLRYVSRTWVFNAAREVEYEIRNDLFAHLQRLPQSFYFRWRTGDLMSRCVNDLNSVRLMLGPGLLSVVQTPIMFAMVFVSMWWIDPTLAWLVLAPYPAFIWIARVFGRTIHPRSLEVQEGLADLSSQVQESVSGIAVVKAYAMEDEQARRFATQNDRLFHRHLRLVRANAAMPAIAGLLPSVAMGIVLFRAFPLMESGALSLGNFFVFAMYIYQLTFPTFIMGWVVTLVQRGAAAMQRIDEVLSTPPSIADRDDRVSVASLSGEIEFRNLTFSYPESGREPALRDVSIHVPAGSRLGVVGPVGSGKTTLASVIPRLYEVEDGQVWLDGIDINRIPLATLRRHIAMVPQDSFLFSLSLRENVAYGNPDASLEEVVRAAKRAQLDKDVTDLPAGYDTLVGERGVMLSGGQRQRAALARALLLEPRVLILDDTLSAVDAETEAAIKRELAQVFEGRTVVVVAHRISTVRDCDQIVVLDAGRVIERGSHAELLAQDGLYARMAREQEREDSESEAGVGEVA